MEINLIWCQSENNVIGQFVANKFIIPWQHEQMYKQVCKEDLKHFKQLTTGDSSNAVLMGYNTWLSIGEKILPNRENFVLTKSHYDELNVLFDTEGNPNLCHPVQTIEEAIRICEFLDIKELWIIGGSTLYEKFLKTSNYASKVSKIYQTIIPTNYSIDSNTILVPDIPKAYFKLAKIEKFKNYKINMYLSVNYEH